MKHSLLVVALFVCQSASSQDGTDAGSPRSAAFTEGISSGSSLIGKSLYSQANEESIVRDFFRDRTNGYFVDVGAAWPIANSNTYYLEKHLGWSGIAIDALPEYGPAWQRERPRSRFFSYLVSDHGDSMEPFYRSELTGISSYRVDREGLGRDLEFEEIQVRTITLDDLLERNRVTKIDFLSMDIEGAEPLALAGFDLLRFRPELVCIEAKFPNRVKITEYFTSRGYRRIDRYLDYDRVNFYFTPVSSNLGREREAYDRPTELASPSPWELPGRVSLALVLAHVLPGLLLVRVLGVGRCLLARGVTAGVLGGVVAASVYWTSLALECPGIYWLLLGAIDLAALYVLWRLRPPTSADILDRGHMVFLVLLFGVLLGAYLTTTGYFFRLDPAGDFPIDPAFTEDALFHTALVEGLQSSYPAELLSFSGARAYAYHAGYHLQVAAWERFFGIDRYDGIYRVGVAWSLALLIPAAYLFGLRFTRTPMVALVATTLLFGGGLGFLFLSAPNASWWSLVFMDASLVSLFLVNPLLPALPLLFAGLCCLDEYLVDGKRGGLIGSGIALAGLFAVKQLLAAQLLTAVVLAALAARNLTLDRSRRAALLLTLSSVPIALGFVSSVRHANETVSLRPLEVVRYSMETLGRDAWANSIEALEKGASVSENFLPAAAATALWLLGFLGLRLVAARGLVRDARSEALPLRKTLAFFVWIGFPLTLLLRIAPHDASGFAREEALNDSFWFATFSGIMLWFWTAEALASVARTWGKARAIVWAAAGLLAFPSTVQHFVHKSRLASEAESVPAAAVEAARAGRDLSGPGEVFVEPPRRVRPSVAAYLAGRPVVHDSFVGYDYMWVSRAERDFRRHAVAQFWSSEDPGYGAWFLSRFDVRWVYNPRDRLSPEAGVRWTTPVFSNDAATLYRVGELPNVALDPPASLALGMRGSAFFGDGWGHPESRPRSRRLLPGVAVLYVPWNEARRLEVSLTIAPPHAGGELTLLNDRVRVEADQPRAAVVLPATSARHGLNQLELFWRGTEPLRVLAIELSQ